LGAPRVGFTRGLLVGSVMPKNLKRYYGRGDLHFVTFSCYRRIALLRTIRARNVFVKALGAIRDRYKFSLVGYVVMPEHVHLLLSEAKIHTIDCSESTQAARGTRSAAKKA
jgi:REP element-mobilizing transposase RayT